MKNLKIFACLLVVGGMSLYGWHLYMKANWEGYISAKPFHVSIKKNNSQSEVSSFIPASIDDLPQDYQKNLEIVKNGDEYIWVSNGNKILTKKVERTPYFVKGKDSDKYSERYIYTDSSGTGKITSDTSQYDIDGCKPNEHDWTGNIQVFQTMDNGDILQFYGYFEVYDNPFQLMFCRYLR